MKYFEILLILFLGISYAFSQNDNHFEMRDEWLLRTDDSVNLFVRQFGVGDTVVVLHGGWGAEHSSVLDAFTNIADKYHFVFYDQRGSLRSACADSLISIAKHTEDVERLRKELGLKKLILVGHSMGSFLGMSYLEKYSENVKCLILIGTIPATSSGFSNDDLNETGIARWERQEVLDTLKAHNLRIEDWSKYNKKQSGIVHRITFAAINMHSVKNWRKLKGAFYYNQSAGVAAALTHPSEWNFTAIIEKTNVPITIIHGDDDFIPLSLHEAWTSTIPNVELKVIENAGHLPWIDEPEVFKNYILSALKKK